MQEHVGAGPYHFTGAQYEHLFSILYSLTCWKLAIGHENVIYTIQFGKSYILVLSGEQGVNLTAHHCPNLLFQVSFSFTSPMKHLYSSHSLFPLLNFPSSWPFLNLFILSGALSSYPLSLPIYENPTYPSYPTHKLLL